MQFELSERIHTSVRDEDIRQALESQFKKVSAKVFREGNLIHANSIHATFGSINRVDQTVVAVRRYDDGYAVFANVVYRPSLLMFVFIILTLWTLVGWLIPIVFYLVHISIVRQAVLDVLQRVKDEFEGVGAKVVSPVPALPVQERALEPVAETPKVSPDEERAIEMFEQAKEFLAMGQKELAIEVLQNLVKRYPRTKSAMNARKSLQKSNNVPTTEPS